MPSITKCEIINDNSNWNKSVVVQHDKLYTRKAARHVELHPICLNNGFFLVIDAFVYCSNNRHS